MSKRNNLAATVMAAAIVASAAGQVLAQATPAKPATPAANANANNPNAMRNAGPEEVFARWDKDKNKVLSLEEFRSGFGEVQTANALRKLHQNFTQMDLNKSNALEPNEFANLEVVKRGGAKAPVLSAFDADKNGKLEFNEYVEMIATIMRHK